MASEKAVQAIRAACDELGEAITSWEGGHHDGASYTAARWRERVIRATEELSAVLETLLPPET